MKVLIIDDQPDWNQAVKTALSLNGHKVETIEHEKSAAAAAVRVQPDIVVLDWDFSGGDRTHALDVKESIRLTAGCATTPILLASKHHSVADCRSDNGNEMNLAESFFSIPRNDTVDVVLQIAKGGDTSADAVARVLKRLGFMP